MNLRDDEDIIVSACDASLLHEFNWTVQRTRHHRYAFTTVNGVRLYLHHAIIGKSPLGVVDHKNGNGLDNRRDNLRYATWAQNNMNSRKGPRRKLSRYRGVRYMARIGKWYAQLCGQHLGCFTSEEEAKNAYLSAATRKFGPIVRVE